MWCSKVSLFKKTIIVWWQHSAGVCRKVGQLYGQRVATLGYWILLQQRLPRFALEEFSWHWWITMFVVPLSSARSRPYVTSPDFRWLLQLPVYLWPFLFFSAHEHWLWCCIPRAVALATFVRFSSRVFFQILKKRIRIDFKVIFRIVFLSFNFPATFDLVVECFCLYGRMEWFDQ